MYSYTNNQRIQIVDFYDENNRLVKNVFRKLRDIYG